MLTKCNYLGPRMVNNSILFIYKSICKTYIYLNFLNVIQYFGSCFSHVQLWNNRAIILCSFISKTGDWCSNTSCSTAESLNELYIYIYIYIYIYEYPSFINGSKDFINMYFLFYTRHPKEPFFCKLNDGVSCYSG